MQEWICDYRECNDEFILSESQISRGGFHFCSRSHAVKESHALGKMKSINMLDRSTFSEYGTGKQAVRNSGKSRRRAKRNSSSVVLMVCELGECANFIGRYPFQITAGKGRFCSQSHAGKWASTNATYARKSCVECGSDFEPRGSTQRYCGPCGERNLAEGQRRGNLKEFGITIEEYEVLLKLQDGKCAICGGEQAAKRLAVDHDHESGNVRGLLCTYCNTRLGWLETHFEAVENYLNKHGSVAQLEEHRSEKPRVERSFLSGTTTCNGTTDTPQAWGSEWSDSRVACNRLARFLGI